MKSLERGLARMSLKEIDRTIASLQQLRAQKQIEERDTLRQKLKAMADESGFTLAELFGTNGRHKSKLQIRYRNPSDTTQTWTGRGRKPKWLAGKAVQDFLVS